MDPRRADARATSSPHGSSTLATPRSHRWRISDRTETCIRHYVRKARFPQLHTVEEFDFSIQPELGRTVPGSRFSPEFVTRSQNLILKGRVGRAKTRLTTAIACRAIQRLRCLRNTARSGSRSVRCRNRSGSCTHPELSVFYLKGAMFWILFRKKVVNQHSTDISCLRITSGKIAQPL